MPQTIQITISLLLLHGLLHVAPPLTSAQEQAIPPRAGEVGTVLRLPAVVKELELSDFQIKEIDAARREFNKFVALNVPGIAGLSPDEQRAARDELKAAMAENDAKIRAALLPHQRKRMDELVVQHRIKSERASFGLLHPVIVEALGISDAQAEKLRAKADEEQKALKERLREIERQLAAARDKAREALLSELDPIQREKYKSLVGTHLELQ